MAQKPVRQAEGSIQKLMRRVDCGMVGALAVADLLPAAPQFPPLALAHLGGGLTGGVVVRAMNIVRNGNPLVAVQEIEAVMLLHPARTRQSALRLTGKLLGAVKSQKREAPRVS